VETSRVRFLDLVRFGTSLEGIGVSGIFICYRREDSAGYAGRLAERLVARFGRAGKPLAFSVREDPYGGGDGFKLAARSEGRLDAKLQRASSCNGLMAAAKQTGAVDVSSVLDDLVLESKRTNVSIVDMHARVLKRSPPLTGASISCASAGVEKAVGVMFNLDEPDAPARTIADYQELQAGNPYFAGVKIVSIENGQMQPFQLVGVSRSAYVEWVVDADVVIDDQQRTVRSPTTGARSESPRRLRTRPATAAITSTGGI
jgi:hypothetical protein